MTVRGLIKSWKQEIYFGFDKKIDKQLLFEILNELHIAGFIVVAMVSDPGPSNQSLWKELNINISKKIILKCCFFIEMLLLNIFLFDLILTTLLYINCT